MTLDEAIKHAEEVAKEKGYEVQDCLEVHDMESAMECEKCGEEHEQLAEWLKELKQLKEQNPCEDAVSRAKAMEICKSRGHDNSAHCISELPSVTPTQRWIPVSERLPENETRVLTTIKIPNRIARVRSGWYDSGFIHNDNGGFFHNDNGDVWKATDMEVIAWMPLPEPYQEETESEE